MAAVLEGFGFAWVLLNFGLMFGWGVARVQFGFCLGFVGVRLRFSWGFAGVGWGFALGLVRALLGFCLGFVGVLVAKGTRARAPIPALWLVFGVFLLVCLAFWLGFWLGFC